MSPIQSLRQCNWGSGTMSLIQSLRQCDRVSGTMHWFRLSVFGTMSPIQSLIQCDWVFGTLSLIRSLRQCDSLWDSDTDSASQVPVVQVLAHVVRTGLVIESLGQCHRFSLSSSCGPGVCSRCEDWFSDWVSETMSSIQPLRFLWSRC